MTRQGANILMQAQRSQGHRLITTDSRGKHKVKSLLPIAKYQHHRDARPQDTVKLDKCLANYSRRNSTILKANGYVLNIIIAGHLHSQPRKRLKRPQAVGRGNTSALKPRRSALRLSALCVKQWVLSNGARVCLPSYFLFPIPRLWVSYVRRALGGLEPCPHDRSLTSRLNTVGRTIS
jgi:hypothetical protein